MNERIEELAKDCFEYIEGTLDGDVVEFNYKMFAKLLIKECSQVAFTKAPSDESACDISQAIEEHFGVEE